MKMIDALSQENAFSMTISFKGANMLESFKNHKALSKATDWLSDHPHVKFSQIEVTNNGRVTIVCYSYDSKQDIRDFLDAGQFTEQVDKIMHGSLLKLSVSISTDIDVVAFINRSNVCERKVVGTEVVEVPEVFATEAHTETRDIYEWECGPLLDKT